LDAVIKNIIQRKDNGSGKLIFCHFREEIDEIANRLRASGFNNVATFDGRTTNTKRFDILNDKNEVLILQIQTGCEGLNLQENYSEIYFISPHWNPAVEDQAIARCHRIGQTKTVYVHRFEMTSFVNDDIEIPTRTIDNYVYDVQNYKRIIAKKFIAN
jgi:SNF2 family DNA or RNA helicase